MRSELQSALAQARTLATEELPRLLGDLEEIRTTALARLSAPAPAPAPDELLEVPEAAHRLGLSPSYLYHHHKRFPFARKIGRKLLFSSAGLEVYVKRAR
jgi:predicted DNA-binding transcriptional regulator AlpA